MDVEDCVEDIDLLMQSTTKQKRLEEIVRHKRYDRILSMITPTHSS